MRMPFLRPASMTPPRPSRPEPGLFGLGLTRRRELILIIVVATAVRFVDFTAPYTSQHWIKQLQIAPIAKHFATKSLNILWPETDYSADRPGYIEIEFQLVTWLTALGWKVFGIHEWVGRLVTIGFSVGSMVLLYRLMVLHIGAAAATYGLLFFAFAPSNWYFSRVLMSEPLMLFFSIATIWAFSMWLATEERAYWWWTAVAGALCFLVKLPTLIMLIPLAYLAWRKWERQTMQRRELWWLGAAMIVPALAYYAHAYYNIGRYYFTVGVGFGGSMWFSPGDFLKPGNYSLMLERLVKQHLTAVGFLLLPLGLLGVDRTNRLRITVFHVWAAAVAVYFVVVSGGNLRQNYYQLPLIPPAAALIGLAWEQLVASRKFAAALSPTLAALFLALSVWGVEPMFAEFTPIRQAARELNVLDPQKSPVIIFPAGYGCLFYFGRPGWVGREGFGKPESQVPAEDVPGPDYIDARILRGAKWAVYLDAKDATGQPLIQQYLRDHFATRADENGYQIFDLTRTPAGEPYQPARPGDRVQPRTLQWR